ncbi:hypothetical protein MTO96_016184 [Rhipicephalus appendiculatus]
MCVLDSQRKFPPLQRLRSNIVGPFDAGRQEEDQGWRNFLRRRFSGPLPHPIRGVADDALPYTPACVTVARMRHRAAATPGVGHLREKERRYFVRGSHEEKRCQ